MSCYVLTSLDPTRFTCRVGWDAARATFYVYIARPIAVAAGGRRHEEAGQVVKWKGKVDAELPTVEDLLREIEGYALLTTEVRDRLTTDQRRAPLVNDLHQGQASCQAELK